MYEVGRRYSSFCWHSSSCCRWILCSTSCIQSSSFLSWICNGFGKTPLYSCSCINWIRNCLLCVCLVLNRQKIICQVEKPLTLLFRIEYSRLQMVLRYFS